jgi:RNA polymerase sigma-70 factor (ECF subfamily)
MQAQAARAAAVGSLRTEELEMRGSGNLGVLPSPPAPVESIDPRSDGARFGAAVAACRPYLLRVASVQLRDRELAEDVVQEALVAAYDGLDRFTGRSSIKTWLTGILKNKILDVWRRRKREPVTAADLQAELDVSDIDELFDSHAPHVWRGGPQLWTDPAKAWEQTAFFDMVDFCLHRLPPSTARVFVMRELFEMEAHEICDELSITQNNLGVLMYRARMALRHCLELNWFARTPEVG